MKKPPFNVPECCKPIVLVNPRALYLLDNDGQSHGFDLKVAGCAASHKNLIKMAYRFLDGDDFYPLQDLYVTRGEFEFEYLFNVVRCGKCDVCLYNKKLDLVNRATFEDQLWPCPAFFFTLTYKPSDLPPGGNLRYKDVQDFFKRLRRSWDRKGLEHNIRYLVAGEYGHDPRFSHRPHYHVILWNNPYHANELQPYLYDLLKSDIFHAWSHAEPQSFDFGQVQGGAAAYAVKYVGKPYLPKGRWIKPFIHMSTKNGGLGYQFIKKYKKFLQDNPDLNKLEYTDFEGKFRYSLFGSYIKNVVHPSPSRLVPPFYRNTYRELTNILQSWVDDIPELFQFCRQLAEDARPFRSILINPIVSHDSRSADYFRMESCKTFRLWKIYKSMPVVHALVNSLSDAPEVAPGTLQKYYDYLSRQLPHDDNRKHIAAKLFRIHEKNSIADSKNIL